MWIVVAALALVLFVGVTRWRARVSDLRAREVGGAGRVPQARAVGRVVVLGGGIAGLTTAHELRRRGYRGEVVLFEALDAVGGVARSGVVPGSATPGRGGLPTEYSWRGFGFDYRTLHEILREIPLTDLTPEDLASDAVRPAATPAATPAAGGGGACVDDRTQDYERWMLVEGAARLEAPTWGRWLAGSQLPWHWRVRVLARLAEGITASAARIRGEYSGLTWQCFLGLSPADGFPHDAAVRAIVPALGQDAYRASASGIVEYVEGSLRPDAPFDMMVFDAPTSEAWFRHWHRLLAYRRAVRIHTGHRVLALRERAGACRDGNNCGGDDRGGGDRGGSARGAARAGEWGVAVRGSDGRVLEWAADAVVVALPPQVAADVLPARSPEAVTARALGAAAQLHMPGVQFYFAEPLVHPQFPAGVFLLRTPWLLTIEPQGATWRLAIGERLSESRPATASQLTACEARDAAAAFAATPVAEQRAQRAPWPHCRVAERYGAGDVCDVWSITLCDDDRISPVTGRPWRQHSRAELVAEVWRQLLAAEDFATQVRGANSGAALAAVRFARPPNVWASFVDARTDRMRRSDEPMISANAGTWALRPATRSVHVGLFWAGTHVRNRKEVVRMDSAAEAGVAAAEAALKRVPAAHVCARTAAAAPPRACLADWEAGLRDGPGRFWPRALAPVRAFDRLLYACGLPHFARLLPALLLAAFLLPALLLFAPGASDHGGDGAATSAHYTPACTVANAGLSWCR